MIHRLILMISLRFNHKVTTFPSGLTLQYPQSPCRRRRVLFSWDSWNLRRASWPEWSVLRPGIRIEKLDFTINSVISSDTGQGNDGLGALPGVQLGYGWGTGGVRLGYGWGTTSRGFSRVGYGWGTVGVQLGYRWGTLGNFR